MNNIKIDYNIFCCFIYFLNTLQHNTKRPSRRRAHCLKDFILMNVTIFNYLDNTDITNTKPSSRISRLLNFTNLVAFTNMSVTKLKGNHHWLMNFYKLLKQ